MSYSPHHRERQYFEPGSPLALESGSRIKDFCQSYIVHGEPASDGSNVVLVTSSLGGDAHRLDMLIGDGLALDPARYCVIATDALGNGWSSSPSNSRIHAGMKFPTITIRDMVAAQRRLLREEFGLEQVLAVAGASMGGMQALQWAVSHPDSMQAIIALVPLARTPPWTRVMNELSRKILMLDPAWQNGEYTEQPEAGWRAWADCTQVIATLSPAYLDDVIHDGEDCMQWLRGREDAWLQRGFDANDWICQTIAYDAHDIGNSPGFEGDTTQALASIRAATLVMGPDLDLLNPADQQREVAEHVPRVRYVPIPSIRGHACASPGDFDDVSLMNREVGEFLDAQAAD